MSPPRGADDLPGNRPPRRSGILDERRAEELRRERELDAEFEAHVAHKMERLVAEGASEEEARSRAWAEFGDPERLKREARAATARIQRGRRMSGIARWLDALRQDLAFALRQLRRRPGLTVVALLTLALGIGGATTIVSVVRTVVFEPLPFQDPGDLVVVEAVTQAGEPFSVAEPQYLDWRDRTRAFEGLAAWWWRTGSLQTPAGPRSVGVMGVTHDLLSTLGLRPVLGRGFRAEDDDPDAPSDLALLGHAAWLRDYGADPEVLGRRLELNGRSVEVVGVAPPALEVLAGDHDVLVPMAPRRDMELRGEHYLSVVGRLTPGVDPSAADEELDALQAELGAIHRVDEGWSATVHDGRTFLVGDRTICSGWVLLGAAGLLLLMACVNVANVLLVRATVRHGEMGMRRALGAGRGRLARQLLTESAVLAVGGGAAGLGMTVLALPAVKALGAARIPRLDGATVDGFTLVACLLAVAVATLASGTAPVLRLGGREPGADLGGAGRNPGGRRGARLRSGLVATQVALTVVLLVGSGLLFRSFVALTSVDPGFEPTGTLAVQLTMPDGSWSWEERRTLLPRVREAVRSVPGVQAAGATAVDPFSGNSLANFVAPEDRLPSRASEFTPVAWRVVTPGFFEAMGMELRAGRDFRPGDGWEGGTPVVIDERLARVTWPDRDPVGRTLVWNDPEGSRLTVVGVVEDLRDVALAETPAPMVYRTHEQIPWAVMTMVARIDGDPAAVAEGIRTRIQEAVPTLPVPEIRSLETNLDRTLVAPRFNLTLLSGFALLGLVMAVVGIYGLTAFDVRSRFREIGIRVSLGARPEAIRRMILRERIVLAGSGMILGVLVAWAASRWVESLLYGVGRADPLTWASVLAVVALASGVAAWIPAGRATRVDPREVLSRE